MMQLVNSLFQASKEENEPFWRLPFEEFHRSQIHFFFADIANTGISAGCRGRKYCNGILSYFVKTINNVGCILIVRPLIVNRVVIYGRLAQPESV